MKRLHGKTFQWRDETIKVSVDRYRNNRAAIQLYAPDGPLAVMTVNLPEVQLADNEAIMKLGQENVRVAEAFLANGWLEETGRTATSGFCTYPILRVKEA